LQNEQIENAPPFSAPTKIKMPAHGAPVEEDLDPTKQVNMQLLQTNLEKETEDTLPPISLKNRFFDVKTLIGFALSAAIIIFFLLTVRVDFGVIFSNIAKANPFYLLAAFAIYYLTFAIRTLRWQMLLHNAGFQKEPNVKMPRFSTLLEFISISWFVNCIVPAKLGDAYRGYLLKKNANASFSRSLGTIVGERIADLLVLFSLLSLGGLIAFQKEEAQLGGLSLVFVFGIVLVVGIVFGLLMMRFWNHKLEMIVPRRLRGMYQKFQQGTVSTFHRKTLTQLYLLTGLVWLCEGARLYFVVQSLGLTLGISVVVFIALTSSLLTTIPFTPAGLGAVEGTIVVVLTTFAVDKNLAGSVAILDRLISYWSVIVVCGLVYIFSKKR
jgi:glycosyltransferase 2 family protein